MPYVIADRVHLVTDVLCCARLMRQSQLGSTLSCSMRSLRFTPPVFVALFTDHAQLLATDGVYRRQRRSRPKNAAVLVLLMHMMFGWMLFMRESGTVGDDVRDAVDDADEANV